jgi:hypothetical protein
VKAGKILPEWRRWLTVDGKEFHLSWFSVNWNFRSERLAG